MQRLVAKPGRLAAVAWAVACDRRRELDSLLFIRWPEGGLTREETRRVARITRLVNEARHEIMSLQSSLSKRSKDAGQANPDYATARKLNSDS